MHSCSNTHIHVCTQSQIKYNSGKKLNTYPNSKEMSFPEVIHSQSGKHITGNHNRSMGSKGKGLDF